MRALCLSSVILFALVAGAARAEDEADAFFKKIEAATLSASTLRFKFKVVMTGPMSGNLEGALAAKKGGAGEKDKLYFTFQGEVNGQKGETTLVSDGKTMKVAETGRETKATDLPDDLKKNFLSLALRGGAFFGSALVGEMQLDTKTVMKTLATSTFGSPAKDVRVEQRDASSIEVDTTSGVREKLTCKTTLWVDAKSLLPIQLVVVSPSPEGDMTIKETWEDLESGKEIDDKTFVLPN